MTIPVFNLEKSLNSVLYITSKLRTKDFHKIFKVLYFADREHLAEYGRTITGDCYIKMDNGPVPSNIYDIFKTVRKDGFWAKNSKQFEKYFSVVDRFLIEPKMSADLDVLSESDIEQLDKSIATYGEMTFAELKDKSHDFAWSSTADDSVITMDKILQERGEDEEYVKFIRYMTTLDKACY